ncbi:hypothetical protein AACA06_13330, partial [Burkholderia contaminans]
MTSLSTSTSTAINGAKTHYYSVNDNGVQQGNYANDGATGLNALAAGVNASAAGASSVAIGNGAVASTNNSVALGANSQTAAANPTSSATVNGVTFGGFAGAAPVGTVSVGSAGNERQITNVAAGQVTSTSTDAINGSQLYSVAQQVGTATSAISSLSTGLSSTNSSV